jgi:hypothetical protein
VEIIWKLRVVSFTALDDSKKLDGKPEPSEKVVPSKKDGSCPFSKLAKELFPSFKAITPAPVRRPS